MENLNTDKIYAEQLAGEYAPKDTTKVMALHKLDQRAKLPALVCAYSLGIVASLVLGVGMCLTMGVIGNGSGLLFVVGVIAGLVGIAGICVNYPPLQPAYPEGQGALRHGHRPTRPGDQRRVGTSGIRFPPEARKMG